MSRTTRVSTIALFASALAQLLASGSAAADLPPFQLGTPMPQTGSQMVAVTGLDGKVYLFGGFDPASPGNATNLARVYDPVLDSYAAIAPMPVAARGACGDRMPDGRIVIAGGFNTSHVSTTQIYDPASNTWTTGATVSSGWECAAVTGADGMLHLFGGEQSPTTYYYYDIATNTWTPGPGLPNSRKGHGAAAVGGKLYVFGGSNSLATLDIYDPALGTWSPGATMPGGNTQFAFTSAGDAIYVLGGSSSNSNDSGPFFGSVWRYDTALGSWTVEAGNLATAVRESYAALTGGSVHLFGGSAGAPLTTHQFSVGDTDGDGVLDNVDNCPADANPGQEDGDADNIGDVCDACPIDPDNDADGDGACADMDNCPVDANPGQEDSDQDGAGDVCDVCPLDADDDADGDGLCADMDNCPADANPGQEDSDQDGAGDVCDACPDDPGDDSDGDGVCDGADNCPAAANPGQQDADGDGAGDACDPCPGDAADDADGDGVCADADNCPAESNPDQADADGDGIGDICDPVDDTPSGGCCQTERSRPTGGMWLLWLAVFVVLARRRRQGAPRRAD